MIDSLESFRRAKVPDDLAMIVIQYLCNWMNRQHFLVDATDNLYKVYGIVEEDLDEFVLHVADEYGRRPPSAAPYWPKPVETVEDVAKYVLSFPEK